MLYSPGDRPGLYQALGEMRGQLEHDEKELRDIDGSGNGKAGTDDG